MHRYGRPGPFSILLVALFTILGFVGGSSRVDVPGQTLVQVASWAAIFFAVLLMPQPTSDSRDPLLFLAAIALVPIVQLVPLPPAIWQKLPGHSGLAEGMHLIGDSQPWRPIAVVPGLTWNAAFALATPAAVLLLLASLKQTSRAWLPGLVVILAVTSGLVALVQFSGNRFEQPMIGYRYDVSGIFGNRNHFALFLAVGCLAIPVWALGHRKGPGWRGAIALGLPVLLVLTVLASGSRAGTAAIMAAMVLGPLAVHENIRRMHAGWPRWAVPTIIIGSLLLVAIGAGLSFRSGRADSINRAMGGQVAEDMRARALPTMLTMTRDYFPVGIGVGGFDPVFRRYEPFDLLKPTYFNQAHDDVLATLLEGGLLGAVVFLAAVAWWIRASILVWRPISKLDDGMGQIMRARFGSTSIGLILGASLVDYPIRTPLMAATLALLAALLAWGKASRHSQSLPSADRPI